MNKKVSIIEDNKEYEGIFIGLGPYGEAQLKINNETKSFLNGSLILH